MLVKLHHLVPASVLFYIQLSSSGLDQTAIAMVQCGLHLFHMWHVVYIFVQIAVCFLLPSMSLTFRVPSRIVADNILKYFLARLYEVQGELL